jgi:midasin
MFLLPMQIARRFSALFRSISDKGAEFADGSNKKPHYSMRTLARALTFAADIAGLFGLRRALWEGMLMAFTMVLDGGSAETVTALAQKHILAGVRNPRSLLAREPNFPPGRSIEEFIKFGPFHLEKGPLSGDPMEEYIMTPSVEKKLIDLARIVMTRRFPVLIEGPTSAGKTSAVEYLARRTGHRFFASTIISTLMCRNTSAHTFLILPRASLCSKMDCLSMLSAMDIESY